MSGEETDTIINAAEPSKFAQFTFWSLWGVLLAFCLLMLIASFSIGKFIGFGVILVLPVVFREKIMPKLLPSLIVWPLAVILIIAVVAITEPPAQNVGALTVVEKNDVSVALLDGVLPEGETISIEKTDNPSKTETKGVLFDTYDISLPAETVMESVAEIKLPFDSKRLSPGIDVQDGIAAAYFDEKTNNWSAVLYQIDAKQGVVTVYTDHFSKYAVVYFKDGRKQLSTQIPEFTSMPSNYSDEEIAKILQEISGGSGQNPTALNAGWNQFNTYYNLSGASGSIMAPMVDAKTFSKVNSLMTQVGAGFAFAQLALDISNGDNKAAVNNLAKNFSMYAASKWGNSALGVACAGVTVMDVAINKFAEKALDKNLQKWEDAYQVFYEKNPGVSRTAEDWYKMVETLRNSSKNPQEFKSKLDKEVDNYCDLFWNSKDADGYAKLAEKTPGIAGFGAGGYYASDVLTLRDRYKQYLYTNTLNQVLERYSKYVAIQELRKAEKKEKELKAVMNQEYTVTVNLANYTQVKNLNGTGVRFKNAQGKVIHSQSFDASGKAVIKMSLLGFLQAEAPTIVEVVVPAQDNTEKYFVTMNYKLDTTNIVLNVPYVPGQPSAEKPQTQTPVSPQVTKPNTTASKPAAPVPPKPVTPVKQEYNYNAALSAWAANYTAKQNSKTFDDGACKTTCQFEWVKGPYIQNGQVFGATRLWYNDNYYAGPKAGTTQRYIASEVYDAANPGTFISVGELKRLYPQFGN